jgi:hypothetical protein
MPVRKAKRTRRPALETAGEYEAAWWNAVYFGPNGKRLTRDDFHRDRFDSEDALRIFYEANRADFAAMAKPGERHPLWWQFDAPEPRDENWPEVAQLHSLRLLTADEITTLRQEAVAEDKQLHFAPWHNGLPFRRSAIFWMFIAAEQRAPDVYESSQLARMGVLTDIEKQIIDSPQHATGQRKPVILPNRTRFYYMPQSERELLGLTYGHN